MRKRKNYWHDLWVDVRHCIFGGFGSQRGLYKEEKEMIELSRLRRDLLEEKYGFKQGGTVPGRDEHLKIGANEREE